MKKPILATFALTLTLGLTGLAVRPSGIEAESTSPEPGLDGVPVKLCTESADADNVYCSSSGEILASQTSATRLVNSIGGQQVSLQGTWTFTLAQLNSQGGHTGDPRAVVFGPIQGLYQGAGSAYLWGFVMRELTVGYPVNGLPTELFVSGLGAPGTGLDTSATGSILREYGFWPLAQFAANPYYVTVYLDQNLNGIVNPGIGMVINSLDGQVWGWDWGPSF